MESVQRRRQVFREAIRRDDLNSRMTLVRTHLANEFHVGRCKDFINTLCISNPSSLLIELANYISKCTSVERNAWAYTSGELLKIWSGSSQQIETTGLPYLLVLIFDQLTLECRRRLSIPVFIEPLLEELDRLARGQAEWGEDLFRVTFQLSIYASEQAHFHINFSEEMAENIINRASFDTSVPSLQSLTVLLLNLDEMDLRGCLKSKILELGRRIYKRFHLSEQSLLHLQTIAAIGLHCCFEKSDIRLARMVLDGLPELQFHMVLRFLKIQSCEEWMSYQIAEKVLLGCASQIRTSRQKNLFLEIICNIYHAQLYCQKLMAHIFKTFFDGRLHHYISQQTLRMITELTLTNLTHKIFKSEFLDCSLMIVRMGMQRLSSLREGQLIRLCSQLMAEQKMTDAELLECLGKEQFQEFWDTYQASQVHSDEETEIPDDC